MITLSSPVLDYVSPGFHLTRGFQMRKYQVRAAHKMFMGSPVRDRDTGFYVGHERDGTNVHIDMGLGKTIIGLTAIVDWFRFGVLNRPVLVIAPLKVCQTVWKQEARNWSHTRHLRFGDLLGNERDRAFTLARAWSPTTGRGLDVVLCNPEKLKWLIGYLRGNWDFFDALIIDDVALKDPKSMQFNILSNYGTRAHLKGSDGKVLRDENGHMIRIPQHRFKRAAKLTGTPSTSGLHRLWAPNYLMDHGARLLRDYTSFEARFFHKGKQVAEHVHTVEINKEEAESRPLYLAKEGAPERIHELVADITIELNAEDYGVLPRVIGDASKGNLEDPLSPNYAPTHIHRVELPANLREQYDRLEREAVIELMGNTAMAQNGGAKSMMCWQIANGAMYVEDQFGRKEPQVLHDLKLDKMVELIERIDSNVVIPYYFVHDYQRIVARLDKEGMAYASFKGKNAERIVSEFSQGKIPILLLHPQSAGHGIDRLQFGGHHFIWFTLLWSLERYLQTTARLARGGQTEIVHNHHIVTTKTTDDLMLINLRQNGNDQERFRSAIREYQRIRGIDYITQNPLEGLL